MKGYVIASSIKNIFRNKFINITVILSFALGLIFPIIVLAIGNGFVQSTKAGLPVYPERIGGVSTLDKMLDVEKEKSKHPEIEDIGYATFAQIDIVGFNNNALRDHVVTISNNYNKIYKRNIMFGRNLTEEELNGNKPVCVISTYVYKELGCSVGNNIILGSQSYEVVGVYLEDKSGNSTVIIPLKFLIKDYEDVDFGYDILLKKGYRFDEVGIDICKSILADNDLPLRDDYIAVASEYFEEEIDGLDFAMTIMWLIAGVILLYATVNIFNILVNKIKKDMASYKIRSQIGASKVDTYLFLFVQIFIAIIIATVIDVLLLIGIKGYVTSIVLNFPMEIDIGVIGTLVIGVTIFSIILCMILIQNVYSNSSSKKVRLFSKKKLNNV